MVKSLSGGLWLVTPGPYHNQPCKPSIAIVSGWERRFRLGARKGRHWNCNMQTLCLPLAAMAQARIPFREAGRPALAMGSIIPHGLVVTFAAEGHALLHGELATTFIIAVARWAKVGIASLPSDPQPGEV